MKSSSDYTSIRTCTLRGAQQTSFDLYILIAEKFILYNRKGDSFEGERLDRILKKGLKKLYILKSEEDLYKSYLRKNIDAAYRSTKGTTIDERALVIQGAQQAVIENLMESPDDPQLFELISESTRKYIEFILKEDLALEAVLKIPNRDKNCAHHGLNVATLAVAICKQLKLTDPELLNEVAMGCFLHDIEYYYSALSLTTDLKSLASKEAIKFKIQPELGFERLKAAGLYKDLVLKIVKGSEELIDGSGYPDGLKESETDPMVALVSTCNAFDRYVGLNEIPIKDALKSILIERMGMHPLKIFQALQSALKQQGAL